MLDSLCLLDAARAPELTSNRHKFGGLFGELGARQEGETRLAGSGSKLLTVGLNPEC